MMMIGHVGWFILACIVHILKHLTSQNEVTDGKINTCETILYSQHYPKLHVSL